MKEIKTIIYFYQNNFQFQFWKVPVYGENSNDILSESELVEQFQLIIANKSKENVPIGMLSSQQRDILAKAYEELIRSKLITGPKICFPNFTKFSKILRNFANFLLLTLSS